MVFLLADLMTISFRWNVLARFNKVIYNASTNWLHKTREHFLVTLSSEIKPVNVVLQATDLSQHQPPGQNIPQKGASPSLLLPSSVCLCP
jgi:hypothetical protein